MFSFEFKMAKAHRQQFICSVSEFEYRLQIKKPSQTIKK